jgi:hypothetical protein
MVQGIGEVESAAYTGHRLLQGWSVFCREAGMGQQVVEHLLDSIRSRAARRWRSVAASASSSAT